MPTDGAARASSGRGASIISSARRSCSITTSGTEARGAGSKRCGSRAGASSKRAGRSTRSTRSAAQRW